MLIFWKIIMDTLFVLRVLYDAIYLFWDPNLL